MMTKRQFEQVAGILRDERRYNRHHPDGLAVLDAVAIGMADLFAADNPRFDRKRFLAAARGEDAKTASGRKVKYSEKGPGEINEVYGGPALGMDRSY